MTTVVTKSTCETCHKSWPEAKTGTYWGADGAHVLCDPCLLAESDSPVKAAYQSGATTPEAHYVATYRPY